MTVWEDLVSAALVGTERRPFPLHRVSEAVNGRTLEISVEEAEAQVLSAAAILAAYRRAGRRPDRQTGDLPEPVAPDERPLCSETATQLLSLLLDGMVTAPGGNTELINEWLTACTHARLRPPERLAVALLELATTKPELRAAVPEALGPLAAWLGRANPDWSWATGAGVAVIPDGESAAEELEAHYARATRNERVLLLSSLRARDREAARQLLASTWSSEAAAERAALLETLADTLDHDDEPFLESVLDDRAASVRRIAAALLDRLPGSRRAERMAERARRLVRFDRRFRSRLAVDLPAELDSAARRDGITDDRLAGTGLKAAWLTQIVAATPLDLWEAHLSLTPDQAVRHAAGHPELIAGWQRAAETQQDERWAVALLALHPTPELLPVLPAVRARNYLADVVTSPRIPDTVVATLVSAVPGPWSVDLGGKVIYRLRQMPAILVGMTVPTLAERLDPATLPAVEAWIARMPEQNVRREVQALAHTLSIRQTIQREFA